MAFSLSSLLNPSPDSDARRDQEPQRDGIPPNASVDSPEEQRSNEELPYSTSQSNTQEAAQALATLSASPVAPPQQWNGYSAQDSNGLETTQAWERRASAYGDPIQLPSPVAGASRKMSSPTLEQYHVASRSPEQRRASIVSSQQSNFTLPPLQNLAQSSDQETRRESHLVPAASSSSHGLEAHTALPPHSQPLSQGEGVNSSSHLQPQASFQSTTGDDGSSTPAIIKQESAPTPQPSSPIEPRRVSEVDASVKALSALKNEYGLRQSPLRESSVPVPTTEAVSEPQSVIPKKRAAPTKKKGTATTMKKEKAPPAKRRKLESKRSATPSSRASKMPNKGNSGKGTPANSSPVASTRSYSAEPHEDDDEDEDEDMDDDPDADVYCICRKPDTGTFMIGCDGSCDDWFHGKCVGIQERDKNLIDKYICPRCTKGGKVGQTSWKRMCRRGGCRQPARVGRKSGTKGSKYCSEECGLLYFEEMVARTRGHEDNTKSRLSRRKTSLVSSEQANADDDIGARGGALSAGEVKSLLQSSNTADEFRRLGDGVLSPPATPDGNDQEKKGSDYTDAETQKLQRIQTDKEEARHRHATLKDRLRFVTIAKQAATRIATEKELKPKEYCGYDPRLEWSEDRFHEWRQSDAGKQAFELDTLQPADKTDGDVLEICDRKKCARHHDWNKLAVDDLRFEMQDNGDRMRALDREERDIKERAALRARAGKLEGEGTVEVHVPDTLALPVVAPTPNGVGPPPEPNGVATALADGDPMAVDGPP